MKKPSKFPRRGFIGAGLLGLGGALGWLARRFQGPDVVRKPTPTSLDSRFVYDVSEYETTDPSLLLYDEAGVRMGTGFKRAKRIAAAPGGGFLVAGDRAVAVFNADGVRDAEIALDRAPHCLHVAGDDELIVGMANYFVVFDFDGREKWRSPRLGERAFLTGITTHGGAVYLADAGSREVLICDGNSGAVIDRFGRKDKNRDNPGFAVPSPYFDLAAGRDGKLRVANPGRLRVETYTLDGRFESSWGEPGMRVDRFCGCCNPVYFALMPDGGFITSEKGLARVNIYDAQGVFKGAVAGPDTLVDDKQLAKRACTDCSVGAGFDVAIDENERVLVLDPFRMEVRAFVPKNREAT